MRPAADTQRGLDAKTKKGKLGTRADSVKTDTLFKDLAGGREAFTTLRKEPLCRKTVGRQHALGSASTHVFYIMHHRILQMGHKKPEKEMEMQMTFSCDGRKHFNYPCNRHPRQEGWL